MTQCVCLGDSLTLLGFHPNGWVNLLQNDLDTFTFINKGFGGYTSREILYSIANMLPASLLHNIDYVTILIGTNDCLNLGNPKGVNNMEYEYNVAQIINYIFLQNEHIRIFLITPPTIRNNNNILEYKHRVLAFKDFHQNVSIINLYAPIEKTAPFMNIDLLNDGVHLNNNGNNKLFLYLLQIFLDPSMIKDKDNVRVLLRLNNNINANTTKDTKDTFRVVLKSRLNYNKITRKKQVIVKDNKKVMAKDNKKVIVKDNKKVMANDNKKVIVKDNKKVMVKK